MVPEVAELNALRLELDLSFQEVADAMRAIGYPLNPRTLHQLIRKPHMTPNERTLFKIRKYLDHVKAGQKRAAQATGRRPSTKRPHGTAA
jgi:hypothetical protein